MKKNLLLCAIIIGMQLISNSLAAQLATWNMDTQDGWTALSSGNSLTDATPYLSFTTSASDGSSILKFAVPQNTTPAVAGVVQSPAIASIPAGQNYCRFRFRKVGGSSNITTGSATLEIRVFLQDPATWTNFNNATYDNVGQIGGAFRSGSINGVASTSTSKPTWLTESINTDSDTDNNYTDSYEWVNVVWNFTTTSDLTNKAVKILFRIGTDQLTSSEINYEFDYIELGTGIFTAINDDVKNDAGSLYVVGKTLFVNGIDNIETYKVYNMSGSVVAQGIVDSPSYTTTLGLSKGIYIVKVGTIAEKIVVD